MPEKLEYACPICQRKCLPFDVVDFNKSCAEEKGFFFELSGIPIYYFLCKGCGFCFAPEIAAWGLKEFEEKIYNEGYKEADPDYLMKRPHATHETLTKLFGAHKKKIRHLDYGGGEGTLSKMLCDSGWKSASYDPFVNKDVKVRDMGTFDFITVFEVFEHVPNPDILLSDLRALLAPGGIVFFTTLLSDGFIPKNERLNWWFASPRNGHISLFSRASLEIIVKKHEFKLFSFNNLFHFLWTDTVPNWASHIISASK
jgi:SAM-dependent methyltransferase